MGTKINHKTLELQGNVVSILSGPKRGYSHKCSIADIKPSDDNYGNKFCWLHGDHFFTDFGQFYITVFTYFNGLTEDKKYKPFGNERITDIWRIKEDKIRITEHATGKEYNFDVPRELVLKVAFMFEAQPLWIRYVIRNGLKTSIAFHLAKRADVWKETKAKIDNAWYSYTVRREEIYWFYDKEAKKVIKNPNYTESQRNILERICWEQWLTDFRNIHRSHRFKINAQNEELKIRAVQDGGK